MISRNENSKWLIQYDRLFINNNFRISKQFNKIVTVGFFKLLEREEYGDIKGFLKTTRFRKIWFKFFIRNIKTIKLNKN